MGFTGAPPGRRSPHSHPPGQSGRPLVPPLRAAGPSLRAVVLLLVLLLSACAGKQTRFYYQPTYGVEHEAFRRSLDALGTRLVPGNQVTLLENGEGFFPAMLEAVQAARHSINLEMYIFEDDEVGQRFARALAERARAGVEVHLLIDAFGARYGQLDGMLEAAGVELRIFRPVTLGSLPTLGDRSHRKLLTIDGRVAFIGGASIDARWSGDSRGPEEWRDVMVRIEGPVVSQLQAIFLEDWLRTTGEVLHGPDQFPSIEPAGDMWVQPVRSAYGDSSSISKLMFYMAIQAARRSIWIQNAYFLPDRQLRRALAEAARRGVDVRIMVPGRHIDFPALWHGARALYGELLRSGVQILEYQPTMLHSKVMVVDDIWVSIGSMNFVNRSMKKNAEANVVIYDRAFAATVNRMVEADMARSEWINPNHFRHRPLRVRVRERFWWLVGQIY